MDIEFSVDWLSSTIHQDSEGYGVKEMFGVLDDCATFEVMRPMHGYTDALRWKHGAIAMRNTRRPEMGTHFILSGETLRELAKCGYDQFFLFRMLSRAGAKFSIIHLALDVHNAGYEPKTMYEQFCAGEYTGRSRKGSQVSERDRGYTAYVGSWNSDRFFRYYDKAAEQNYLNDWKRLELVLKGDYAKAFAWEAKDSLNFDELSKFMRGTVKAMANMSDEKFQQIMAGEAKKLTLPLHRVNSTRHWLLTQVVSAIAKYMTETGDESIIDSMGEEITKKYNELAARK